MKLNIKLNKKTILIISGISVGIIVLSLGVGLGVGLSSSSSSSKKEIVTESIYRAASHAFSADDIENKQSVTIDNGNYSVVEDEGKFYLNVPATNDLTLSSPTIVVPKMFNTSQEVIYNSLTMNKWGKGKDGFYQVDFMDIGPIKIVDTTIYGGFEEIKDNQDVVTGYRVHNLLDRDIYPNGYQIGSFDENGGGINMFKLEKLKYLIDGDNTTTEDNAKTTTEFGFFAYTIPNSEKTIIRVLTSSNPENNLPENIGISLQPKSNDPIQDIPQQDIWYDTENEIEINPIKDASNSITGYQQRSSDIDFKVGYFKKRDGSDYKITLNKDDEVYATKEVSLNELYMPITFEGGSYVHNILGLIKQSKDGKIHLPPNFVTNPNDDSVIDVANLQFNLPDIKLLLKKSVFNNDEYATEASSRSANELLINSTNLYIEYFRKIANLPEVKDLAKKYGITIRFKNNNPLLENKLIRSKGVFDSSVSQVFFPSFNNLYHFNNMQMVAPLKFILKRNLENENYFINRWRKIGKIGVQLNKDLYGLYPFSQSTQYIAYNKDYLPNGFDFSNKDLSDYLYQDDLGDFNKVSTFINEEDVNEDAKTSLITSSSQEQMFSVIWGNDFYSSLKKDQKELEWDLSWKVQGTENDYYSVLLDPNLKNNAKFKAWIDYYRNSNANTWLSPDYTYHKRALLNGHIGGILLNNVRENSFLQTGEYRSKGTDEEKKEFALNKIGFQPIPRMGTSNTVGSGSSVLSAMTSSLKNDPKKQELAEMFINKLTTHNNFEDLAESLNLYTPRKDIQVEKSRNKIIAKTIKTMANTAISVSYPSSFLGFFVEVMAESKETLNPEKVIDDFKMYLSFLDYNVLPPENP